MASNYRKMNGPSACNLRRHEYWLYVVFDCATPHPRLARVRDPFGKMLEKMRESTAYTITESQKSWKQRSETVAMIDLNLNFTTPSPLEWRSGIRNR